MAERLRAFGAGLVSAIVIAALLVLPPLALVAFVGNPMPDRIPDPAAVLDALARTGVGDDVVVNVLAILAWIIWAQIAAALTVEVFAVARQRPTRRLLVLPGLQPLAANLVAAVLLVPAPWSGTRAVAEPIPTFAPPSAAAVVDVMSGAADPPPTPAVQAPSRPAVEYTVKRHDSFWSIAETHLGDGLRWQEIRDRNVGRPQPDGGMVSATSDLVRPGWTLELPGDIVRSSTSVDVHAVAPGDHLWGIAEAALEDELGRPAAVGEIDPYWREVIETNRPALVDPGNPSLILPGQEMRLPPIPGVEAGPNPADEVDLPMDGQPAAEPVEEPVETPPPAPESSDHAHADPQADTSRLDDLESRPEDGPSPSQDQAAHAPWTLGAAGVGLATAIAVEIGRRRRRRQATVAPGLAVPSTPADLADVHHEVATRADDSRAADLLAAMGEIARHLGGGSSPSTSRPRLVQVTEDRIEALLDVPSADAPPGWVPEATGAVWTRPRTLDSDPSTDRAVMPLLVAIGRPDDGTEMLLDLEAVRVTTVVGATPAEDLTRSILTELCVDQDRELEIVVAGELGGLFPHHEPRPTLDVGSALERAISWAKVGRDALAAVGLPSTLAARGSEDPIDGLIPMLLVLDRWPDGDDGDALQELLALAASGAPVAVLVLSAEPSPVGVTLQVDEDLVSIPELNLGFTPQRLSAEAATTVEELLGAADQPAIDRRELIELKDCETPQSSNGIYEDPPHHILVRVLGEVAVEGSVRPLTAKQLGVLTYLALHPDHSGDRIGEAVWPHLGESRRNRLHVTLSQVRGAIGPEHLPTMSNLGTYRVGPGVTTDLGLFRSRVAYARSQPTDVALPILQGALDLVTGPVFSYRRTDQSSFSWVDLEHWISDTEALVVDVAWQTSEMCHEAGDTAGALHAARQGLLGSPANTALTEALMKSYAESGDHHAAESVFTSHARALDQLGLGDPDPSTIDLREQLLVSRG